MLEIILVDSKGHENTVRLLLHSTNADIVTVANVLSAAKKRPDTKIKKWSVFF